MTKLSERTVLASLHIGMWSGSSVDRDVTEEVSENHSADLAGAGRYSKQLIAKKFLRNLSSKVNVMRRIHRTLTLPWDDDARILSTSGYQHYTEQMRLQRLGIEAAREEFVKGLPDYIQEAKVRLGTMYDKDDYADAESVRKKFYADVEIKPVPEAGDFRAELSDKSVKAIVADIEKRSNDRLEKAMSDVFERIVTGTEKMVERLRAFKPAVGEEKAQNVFRDSLVTNIMELAELLPSLNITQDKRLDNLQKRLLKDLTAHSPEVLRIDSKVRDETAMKAEKILAKVRSYLA